MAGRYSLAAAHIGLAIAACAVASAMGVLQALSMADVPFPIRGESLYYLALTAHGVLMALVFTTFYAIGLGYVVVEASLGRIVARGVAWIGFWMAVVGALVTAVTILRGQSS